MPTLVPVSPPYSPFAPRARRPRVPGLPDREPLLLAWICAEHGREWGDPGQPSEGGALPDESRRRQDPGEDRPAGDDEIADDDEIVS